MADQNNNQEALSTVSFDKQSEHPILGNVSAEMLATMNSSANRAVAIDTAYRTRDLTKKGTVEYNRIDTKILAIHRDQNRETYFNYLQNPAHHTQDPQVSELLKESTASTVSAEKLLKAALASKDPQMLGKLYAYVPNPNRKDADVPEVPLYSNAAPKAVAGMDIAIDFGANKGADRYIGASDILGKDITAIKITDEVGNSVVGIRRIVGGRLGYYTANNEYIAIHSQYKIHIPTDQETKTPEYTSVWDALKKDASSYTSYQADLKNPDAEKKAKEHFIEDLKNAEIARKTAELTTRIFEKYGEGKKYKEKVESTLAALKKPNNTIMQDFSATPEEINLVQAQLQNTLDVLDKMKLDNFDFTHYKDAIAKVESGGNYSARNDKAGRELGIKPLSWAFGKYQFTCANIAHYAGIDVGVDAMKRDISLTPNESKLQEFFHNPTLQESAMDGYIIDMMNQVMSRQSCLQLITADPTKIYYLLAMSHIGGAGALDHINSYSSPDWLGTSKEAYATKVWEDVKTKIA